MNVLDATVKTVDSEPELAYGVWWVRVTYDCWGHEGSTKLMLKTKEEALAVKPGYVFQT